MYADNESSLHVSVQVPINAEHTIGNKKDPVVFSTQQLVGITNAVNCCDLFGLE